jgi:hypothetical protein
MEGVSEPIRRRLAMVSVKSNIILKIQHCLWIRLYLAGRGSRSSPRRAGNGPTANRAKPVVLRRYSAPVAQGIERRFPKPCVACSNHAGGAIQNHPSPGTLPESCRGRFEIPAKQALPLDFTRFSSLVPPRPSDQERPLTTATARYAWEERGRRHCEVLCEILGEETRTGRTDRGVIVTIRCQPL